MEHKKKFKKIGFIFGLEREMKLFSSMSKKKYCVYGYGKSSKDATRKLLKLGVDVVINFGFVASISKKLKNGDIVLIDKIFNEKKEKLSTLKFDEDFLKNFKNNFNFVKCNLLTTQKIVKKKKDKLNLTKKFKSVSVIDMEAFYIKKELSKSNVPMISLKVIFDDLSFDIPSYILDSVNEKGEIRIVSFLNKLIANPKRVFDILELTARYYASERVLKGVINAL